MLTLKQLEEYEYHWFWGLRFSASLTQENIAKIIQKLITDEESLNAFKRSVSEINRYPAIIRLVYWFFNIHNYGLNLSIMNLFKREKSQSTFGSWMPCWNMSFISSISVFSPTIENLQSNNEMPTQGQTTSPLAIEVERRQFLKPFKFTQLEINEILVTSENQSEFEALGFKDLSINQEITWSDVKSVFRKAVLQSHPDKGGTGLKFKTVHDAYN